MPVDAQTAEQAEASGAGLVMDLPAYKQAEEKTSAAMARFRKEEAKIKASDDPRYTAEVKAYELRKLREQLDEEIDAINEEWTAARAEIEEQARQQAAAFTVQVSDSDRAIGEQLANRYALRLAAAPAAMTQSSILRELAADIGRLQDGARAAVQPHLLNLRNVLAEGVNMTNVLTAAQMRNAPELAAGRAADRLHTLNPTYEHQMFRVIRGALPAHDYTKDPRNR
ncbi:hypothetical protein [Bhargavaea beijingensis]|uniref:hypothetical protein n=1 Tax=Bhargavaea beijingensis TaxID=426756 RepID=UPI00222559F8|nr:hypothetical protein [Bhargavaea beijingensis]MCW1926957.1 hypothetical protein [Bhargavaea beijingensis]